MVPRPTRRTVLRSGGILAATALAGCSALPGGGGSSDPDRGPDSYGIRLENSTDQTYTVTITAEVHGGSETVFDETVEVSASGSQEWDQILTEEGQYLVKAVVDDDHFLTETDNHFRTVSVGAPNSYDVENVTVSLENPFDDVEAVSAEVFFEGRA